MFYKDLSGYTAENDRRGQAGPEGRLAVAGADGGTDEGSDVGGRMNVRYILEMNKMWDSPE